SRGVRRRMRATARRPRARRRRRSPRPRVPPPRRRARPPRPTHPERSRPAPNRAPARARAGRPLPAPGGSPGHSLVRRDESPVGLDGQCGGVAARLPDAHERSGGTMDEVATGRIVERSGLEAALSREDLEAVLGRISEGITLQTPDGRIVYANEAAADLLRLETPEDVVGAPMGEHRRRFEIFDIGGRPLDPSELP